MNPGSQEGLPNNANHSQSQPFFDRELIDSFSSIHVAEDKRNKALKGSVVVGADKGWLRLVWTFAGKRYFMAMGLPDTKTNRAIAEAKAKIIYRDIISDNFDPTLEKYKPQPATRANAVLVVELFEKWLSHKAKQVEELSLEKMRSFTGHLEQFFRRKDAALLSEDDAFKFRDWLLKRNAPITVRERIGWLRSCWKWAIRRTLVAGLNPWDEVKVKVAPKQKQPFTREEVGKILKGFEAPEFKHYRDYAEFLLSIGCRPGEANGLRWRHLSPDCSKIWIGESLGRERRQKPTKTNKERFFELTPRLQIMLLSRRPEKFSPDDLVFTSVEGQQIDDKNFCKRYWKKALESVGVPYRRPYNSRHSFVSIGVDQGVHPGDICEVTGHSPETLYRHYLGSVRGKVKLPELWS